MWLVKKAVPVIMTQSIARDQVILISQYLLNKHAVFSQWCQYLYQDVWKTIYREKETFSSCRNRVFSLREMAGLLATEN